MQKQNSSREEEEEEEERSCFFGRELCCALIPSIVMKTPNSVANMLSYPKKRSWVCSLFVVASFICAAYFIVGGFTTDDYTDSLNKWKVIGNMPKSDLSSSSSATACKDRCRPSGSEPLPKGIVSETSNLEMQPLWGADTTNDNKNPAISKSLLAIAVGIKQKEVVDRIVRKFPWSHFVVMLLHYDGNIDGWKNLEWSSHAIHVSAVNQTKWWFAKRFLHPDIVFEYEYIFLWDEDIGVDNFNPIQYISIVKEEGLEISQPALDSGVHHLITARSSRSRVHRRMYKFRGSGRCDSRSTKPPCVGWVEMMVPVFSKAAWRCVWHMIQNDLIHAWGLDQLLGYCAQGDRTKNVGVVDSEYIGHLGLPTLGVTNKLHNDTSIDHSEQENISRYNKPSVPSESRMIDYRLEVRKRSFVEMQIFRRRWKEAVDEDQCWVDPFQPKSSLVNTSQTAS